MHFPSGSWFSCRRNTCSGRETRVHLLRACSSCFHSSSGHSSSGNRSRQIIVHLPSLPRKLILSLTHDEITECYDITSDSTTLTMFQSNSPIPCPVDDVLPSWIPRLPTA